MDLLESKWIWHPEWKDEPDGSSAGGFVHFRKSVVVRNLPAKTVAIHITADTKYKLYINSKLVAVGPVKGDEHLWFYDQIDIQPFLREGVNNISVRVMRLFHATPYATSFPRTPFGGLYIRTVAEDLDTVLGVQSDGSWETALDLSTLLRTDLKEDDFLHIYEAVNISGGRGLNWMAAKELQFPSSHGLSAPWKLSPRMIPPPRYEEAIFKAIHNLRSSKSQSEWESVLLGPNDSRGKVNILLSAGSHHVELEVETHMTAFLDFKFRRPLSTGSSFRATYSECYEDTPEFVPYVRCKGQRLDTSKQLLGPEDIYHFGGNSSATDLMYHGDANEEVFSPFHFRTFRFISLDIEIPQDSELALQGIDLTKTTYPLEVLADFNTHSQTDDGAKIHELWTTSLRTLQNCMHDCYEDCPFYEQLQYAMDIRSSALFTYSVSGDDRMARQAIVQLHNSYRPSLGLTASRAPAHQYQVIPHFSLFWICMVTDHFEYFNDPGFSRQFLAVCDGVLETFARRIDPELGLIRSVDSPAQWDFVDWTEAWKPMGIPPAAERTRYQSYTNMLYAYTLKRAADLVEGVGRPALAGEYRSRAEATVQTVTKHCFNGNFFTDGLASTANPSQDLSQNGQVWAVLCGAAEGDRARNMLNQCLRDPKFTPASISMSFYTLRALSLAGGGTYNDYFHQFWNPWRAQLAQGVTTWVEDSVTQRSDCHAWGSAPLYEFLAEVAGIKPAEPGWSVVSFSPRVGLFPSLDAKVPFMRGDDTAIAHVSWRTREHGTDISLSIKTGNSQFLDVPVRVCLPDGQVQMMSGREEIVLRTE
ncbi:Six-hairpin glycosidase-like protein [Leptodontidium sp. MPI-SDFR-AT-0119]|nr:Six-hairpin glycosidase-like protein [Leptodontidium sp. MPI-SDFR-AT-0119]